MALSAARTVPVVVQDADATSAGDMRQVRLSTIRLGL